MGANPVSKGGGNVRYFTIVQSNFHQKVNPDTPGAVKRTNKLNAEVHEFIFGDIDGEFKGIEFRMDGLYGPEIRFMLWDNGEMFSIAITLDSDQGRDCLKRVASVKIGDRVKVKSFIKEEPNPDNPEKPYRNYYFLIQRPTGEFNDYGEKHETIKSPFTKESRGGLPEWEKVVGIGGKVKWSKDAQTNWLMENTKKLVPYVRPTETPQAAQQAPPVAENPVPTPVGKPNEVITGGEEDDLPF